MESSGVETVENRASRDVKKKVATSHVEPVEVGGVPAGIAGLEPMDFGHLVGKVNIQTFTGNRKPGK